MAAKRLAREAFKALQESNAVRMPPLKNKKVYGTVIASPSNSAFCEVDCSLSALATVPKKEIRESGNVTQGERLVFFVEYLWTPFNEPQVVPAHTQHALSKQQQQYSRVWSELKYCMRNNINVKGRVLNSLPSGFAVAVGGYVAFMPRSEAPLSVEAGAVDHLILHQMTDSISNIVVGSTSALKNRKASMKREIGAAPSAGLPTTGGTPSKRQESPRSHKRQRHHASANDAATEA